MKFYEIFPIIEKDDTVAAKRKGWNGVEGGKTMFIKVQYPDEHSQNNIPYLFIFTEPVPESERNYTRVPWVPSQADMFSDDWLFIL